MKKSYLFFGLLFFSVSLLSAQSSVPGARWLTDRAVPALQVTVPVPGSGPFFVFADSAYMPVLISAEIDGNPMWLKQAKGMPQTGDMLHWEATEQGVRFSLPAQYSSAGHTLTAVFLVDRSQLRKHSALQIAIRGESGGSLLHSFPVPVPPSLRARGALK